MRQKKFTVKHYYYISKLTGMVHLSNKRLPSDNWLEISYAMYMRELAKQATKYDNFMRTLAN